MKKRPPGIATIPSGQIGGAGAAFAAPEGASALETITAEGGDALEAAAARDFASHTAPQRPIEKRAPTSPAPTPIATRAAPDAGSAAGGGRIVGRFTATFDPSFVLPSMPREPGAGEAILGEGTVPPDAIGIEACDVICLKLSTA
jgi:hypothetical protein